MKTLLQRIACYDAIAGISFALLLCFCLCFWWLGLSVHSIAEIRAFRCFYALLLVALAVRAGSCWLRGVRGEAFILLALVAALLQGAYSHALAFSGKTSVGLDGEPDNFYAVDAGFAARPPRLPLVLLAGQPGAATCRVSLDGKERQLATDRTVTWQGHAIALKAVHEAPLFILSDQNGAELEAGYMKLYLDRPEGDYFQFNSIPHRFYLSRSDLRPHIWKKTGELWKHLPPAPSPHVAGGEGLRLSIVRGKLSLYDGPLRPGEPVVFENKSARLEKGVPWVEISVVRLGNVYLLYLAAALGAAGLLLLLRRRRS